jgi:hypothetical protein
VDGVLTVVCSVLDLLEGWFEADQALDSSCMLINDTCDPVIYDANKSSGQQLSVYQ